MHLQRLTDRISRIPVGCALAYIIALCALNVWFLIALPNVPTWLRTSIVPINAGLLVLLQWWLVGCLVQSLQPPPARQMLSTSAATAGTLILLLLQLFLLICCISDALA